MPITTASNSVQSKIAKVIAGQLALEEQLLKRKISMLECELERGELHLKSINELINSQRYLAYQLPSSTPTTHIDYNTRQAKRTCIDNIRSCVVRDMMGDRKISGAPRRTSSVYAKRTDGAFVKFECPECGKGNFNSRVGFFNHCRTSHGLRYHSVQEYVEKCGVPVDEREIPADDPCRWEQTVSDFYNMDNLVDGNDDSVNATAGGEDLPDIKEFDGPNSRYSTTAPSIASSSTMQDYPGDLQDIEEEAPHGCDISPMGLPSVHVQRDKVSRFYIKKRVIIGTTSQVLSSAGRSNDSKNTHKWSIYVKCPNPDPRQPNEISTFVRAVKFYLHPSLKPNDVITCDSPPFSITSQAWGEFPIRVRLYFWDGNLNKPIDLIHQLTLCRSDLRGCVQGAQVPFDIELSRESHFMEACGPSDLELEAKKSLQEKKELLKEQQHEQEQGHRSHNELQEEDSKVQINSPATPSTPDEDKNEDSNSNCNGGDSVLFAVDLDAHRTAPSQDITTLHLPKKLIDYCKFCGSNLKVHRFDWSVDSYRQSDTPTPPHDPCKCQFRPVTRKGKVRSIFTTLIPCNSLVKEAQAEIGNQACLSVDSDGSDVQVHVTEDCKGGDEECDGVEVDNYLSLLEFKQKYANKRTGKFEWSEKYMWPMKLASNALTATESPSLYFEKTIKLMETKKPNMRANAEKTAAIMYEVTRVFLKRLIGDCVDLYKKEKSVEEEDDMMMKTLDGLDLNEEEMDKMLEGKPKKILTPFHLYRVVYDKRKDDYDFLSNAYLEQSNS